jgi:uncharacterized protein (DUF1684 family)
MHRPIALLALALLLLPALAPPASAQGPDPEWLRELGDWRTRRFERLRAPDGWLTLVGLYWLHEGKSRFGSSPASELLLAGAPPLLGTLEVAGGKAIFEAAPGVEVLRDGQRVGRVEMAPDATGAPTVLTSGSLTFFVIARGERLALRVRDSQAATRLEFAGLEQFPVHPAWRVRARLDPAPPGTTFPVPNVTGTVDPTPTPGSLVFQVGGTEYRLVALQEDGAKELFLVFGDRTNGQETYGGGRFLYAPAPGPDGATWLDFNRAYNPPCAFTPYATCPLPPRENRLPIRVEAGEKSYAKGH